MSTKALMITFLSAFIGGCGIDSGDADSSHVVCDTECEDPDFSEYICQCDLNLDGVFCDPANPPEDAICNLDSECIEDADAERWCDEDVCRPYSSGEFDGAHTKIACVTNPNSGSCGSWSPQSHITLTGGVRYVGATWLAGLVGNPAPLWTCDDAYLAGNVGAGFTVTNASSGEFLYELGLRNGDRPLAVNGYTLHTWTQAITAFGSLYLSGTTSYTLLVKRGANNVTFSYVLQ